MQNITLSWDDFWMFYKNSSTQIKEVLLEEVTKVQFLDLRNGSKKILKEVFDNAPEEIQHMAGYRAGAVNKRTAPSFIGLVNNAGLTPNQRQRLIANILRGQKI